MICIYDFEMVFVRNNSLESFADLPTRNELTCSLKMVIFYEEAHIAVLHG
jgi:hypothetical protein